ncbi:hypothetical protein LEMLEM_LOCUS9012 [Lemmus lemmus]
MHKLLDSRGQENDSWRSLQKITAGRKAENG